MANPAFDIAGARGRKRTWRVSIPAWLVLICLVTHTVLISAGAAIYKNAPPISAMVVSPQQDIILTQEAIEQEQAAYLARGGQHIGSIWGHGGYPAPKWTADVLHRWRLATAGALYNGDLDFEQTDLEALPAVDWATLLAKVKQEFKLNCYDADTGALMLTTAQTQGLKKVFADYQTLLLRGSAVHSIPSGWFTDTAQIRNVTVFFGWTAWVAAATRPNSPLSYTANFPHDVLRLAFSTNRPRLDLLS